MAKKKAAKKKSGPAKKAAPAKGAKKKAAPPEQEQEMIEIVPDAVEQEALDLVQNSENLCDDLEEAVTAAVSKAVGTVFKKHKVTLSAAQAENVALILFGN